MYLCTSISDNFKEWTYRHPKWIQLPIMICWHIWKTRNFIIFEQQRYTIDQVVKQILTACCCPSIRQKKEGRPPRRTHPPEHSYTTYGTFDGAQQGGRCGGGGTISLIDGRIYLLKVGLGTGSNTRAELLSLWSLLWFARRLDCEDIHILGDSKTIIDWINGENHIRNSALFHWLQRISNFRDTFHSITFQHQFREYNAMADSLSKEGLNMEEGLLMVKEASDNTGNWESHNIYIT